MTDDDTEVMAGHAARLAALDRLLAAPALPLDDPERLLRAHTDGGRAIGRWSDERIDPTDDSAVWGALRTASLSVRVSGDDREDAISDLLDRWDDLLRRTFDPGNTETAAAVRWPSRDLVGARSLVRHGFAPLTAIAVRSRGRSAAPERAAVAVRPARGDDLERLADAAVELLRADVAWGVLTERPNQRETLRAGLADGLEDDDDLVLVAETGDGVCGFVQVSSPEHSTWITDTVTATPAVYLSSLYVDAAARSAGVGQALARAAHEVLDQRGVAATVLNYGIPSPVSAPFWARMGYRPVWTLWYRRPAVPR